MKNSSMQFNWLAVCCFNPLKPEFTIVIFIHYKLQIAVEILDTSG